MQSMLAGEKLKGLKNSRENKNRKRKCESTRNSFIASSKVSTQHTYTTQHTCWVTFLLFCCWTEQQWKVRTASCTTTMMILRKNTKFWQKDFALPIHHTT